MAEQEPGAPAASHADMPKAGEAAKPADPVASPEAERIATLERENADLKDRLLRTLAEMENLRRRTEREVQDGRVYAITKFAGDMILSADNLRRALDTVPKASEAKDGEEAEAPDHAAALAQLLEGVALTERELLKALEKNGVKKRDPKGERFDPHRDQAMFEIPDETVPSGTVVQVVQAGYIIGERVLRPAMVGVSRGGPARPLNETSTSPAESATHEASGGAKPRVDKRA